LNSFAATFSATGISSFIDDPYFLSASD